ncbi:MAG: dynamin family protein [Phormidesmis sp.]
MISGQNPLGNWEQFGAKRQTVITTLKKMVATLESAETENRDRSGGLGLSGSIQDLKKTATDLAEGTYRLMVMGDMKRGKSTLLNALLGENLLPSDVNPCTALLTVLRYGDSKRVILHFKDSNRAPETVSIETFRQTYVIDPTESKRLAEQGTEAFPHMSHVVVEYPLALLKQGIELVDTPGLNDTEARNDLVLSYLNDCHAILFVLEATQPFTLDERRYLNNYLKASGLALFFVINGWDKIATALVDPDDAAAVTDAERKVRQVFSTHLEAYINADQVEINQAVEIDQAVEKGQVVAIDQRQEGDRPRVFEISALQALRQQLKGQSLEGTGLPALMASLDGFLANERGPAELQRTVSVAQRVSRSVSSAITRRIPLINEPLAALEAKVASVQGDFDKLEEIRDRYRKVIRTSRDIHTKTIGDSFQTYILNLEKTFEEDFAGSQPDLEFLQFLEASERQRFYREFKRAFERYINDRLAAWEFTAKQSIGTAFDELNESAFDYQVAYAEVVDIIHQKIMGNRFYAVGPQFNPDNARTWADSVKDVFEDIPSHFNSSINGFNYFWQSVFRVALVSICVSVAMQVLGLIFSSLFLNIVGVLLATGGIFAVQAEVVRQEFFKATKKGLVQQLPRIANEQTPHIRNAVKECFIAYEEAAIERISQDIASRRVELSNLVEQKQQREINQKQEIVRLQQVEQQVNAYISSVEAIL